MEFPRGDLHLDPQTDINLNRPLVVVQLDVPVSHTATPGPHIRSRFDPAQHSLDVLANVFLVLSFGSHRCNISLSINLPRNTVYHIHLAAINVANNLAM